MVVALETVELVLSNPFNSQCFGNLNEFSLGNIICPREIHISEKKKKKFWDKHEVHILFCQGQGN